MECFRRSRRFSRKTFKVCTQTEIKCTYIQWRRDVSKSDMDVDRDTENDRNAKDIERREWEGVSAFSATGESGGTL